MSWGAKGIQGALVLWVSRCFTEQEMLSSPLKCLQHWGEFHTLSAFPKSGVQLQKSWQLSTLNWLGIRHLFLRKNSQGFKIASMMKENEMLRGKKKKVPYFYMCTCVCEWVAGSFLENPAFRRANKRACFWHLSRLSGSSCPVLSFAKLERGKR